MSNNNGKDKDNSQNNQEKFSPFSLAFELGYTIAIPIVALGLVGRLLDKKFDSSPVLLLAGILLSIIISSIGIYKKVVKIIGK